jgi:hypothetical protein
VTLFSVRVPTAKGAGEKRQNDAFRKLRMDLVHISNYQSMAYIGFWEGCFLFEQLKNS